MKVCIACKTLKEDSEFAADYGRIGGLSGQCKSCKSIYDANRKSIRAKQKRDRIANDPVFALKCDHRTTLYSVIKSNGNYIIGSYAYYILGCESTVFIDHMESLFASDMYWENHGEWELDHIIPMVTAKTIDDVMTISHYKNLQPLWKADNMKKKHFVSDDRPPVKEPKPDPRVLVDIVDRPSLSNNDSASKLAGVTFNKERQKWRVRIKQICYGLYEDYDEAEQVCLAVRKKIYGDV